MAFIQSSVFLEHYHSETQLVNIKQYFADYEALLEKTTHAGYFLKDEESNCIDEKEYYKKFLNIGPEELKSLETATSISLLDCPGEVQPFEHKLQHSRADFRVKYKAHADETCSTSLTTVEQHAELKSLSGYPSHYLKYEGYTWPLSKKKKKAPDPNSNNILYSVKVYHPSLSYKGASFTKFRLMQETEVLGDQTLLQLKDDIQCFMDYVGTTDVSEDVNLFEEVNISPKINPPSSFIFIENTFYNDIRGPEMRDLSKSLISWGQSRGLGTFKAANMASTKLNSLSLKLGHPYVYQHQGNCEHILVFSDVRLLCKVDVSCRNFYPNTLAVGRSYGRKCYMCAELYACWLVVGSSRLPYHKSYLCAQCFTSYHYLNGVKIGQFQAYRYVDQLALH